MAKKRFNAVAAAGLVCLLAIPFATAQGSRPAARRDRNALAVPPRIAQPVGPCRLAYAGHWFASNGIRFEVQENAGRLTWSVPALDASASGGCEGNVVWADWSGPLGEGRLRGIGEGRPGGPAVVIRWSDQRTFVRIPDLSITANRNTAHKGETVELVSKIDPPDVPVSRYFISFGDGQEDGFQPPSAVHAYQDAGVFDVVLTAVLLDERFTSPPFQIRVFEEAPASPPVFRLEVERRFAAVGEELRVRGVLEPTIPGAVYSFSFGGQASPLLSSPTYSFRCDSPGVWIARASVRFTGGNFAPIDSLPLEITVQGAAPPPDHTWLVWIVPVIAVAGMAGMTFRRVYRKRREKKRAEMRLRVKFERHSDVGRQAIIPDQEKLYRSELVLRPGLDVGTQQADRLLVVDERRGQ